MKGEQATESSCQIPVSIWGQANYRSISETSSELNFEGGLTTASVGLDVKINGSWLGGLLGSKSSAKVDVNKWDRTTNTMLICRRY